MKLSELIAELQNRLESEGDIPVAVWDYLDLKPDFDIRISIKDNETDIDERMYPIPYEKYIEIC
jgi:hypothetical protein